MAGALIWVTMLAGMTSVMIAGMVNRTGQQVKQARSLGGVASPSSVFENVLAVARSPGAMRASALTSPALAACLRTDGLLCVATGQGRFEGFELRDERSVVRAGPWPNSLASVLTAQFPAYLTGLRTLTNFPMPAVRYDVSGRYCGPSGPGANPSLCRLGAYASFRAWCPFPLHPVTGIPNRTLPRTPVCDKAEYIQVFAAVGERVSNSSLANAVPLASEHNASLGSPSALGGSSFRSNEVLLSADEIASNGDRRCPTGTVAAGMDANGFPVCDYTANPCATSANVEAGRLIPSRTPQGEFECRRPLQGEACGGLQVLFGVLPSGALDCRHAKFASAGCGDGLVAVRYQADGSPVCVRSHVGAWCPNPAVLVAFDGAGNAICRNVQTTFWGRDVNLQR